MLLLFHILMDLLLLRRPLLRRQEEELCARRLGPRFAAIFPGGNRAFTVARDGGRATGQIIVNASVDESPRLRSWLKSLSAGYLVSVAASDEYNYAVAVEKQFLPGPRPEFRMAAIGNFEAVISTCV